MGAVDALTAEASADLGADEGGGPAEAGDPGVGIVILSFIMTSLLEPSLWETRRQTRWSKRSG